MLSRNSLEKSHLTKEELERIARTAAASKASKTGTEIKNGKNAQKKKGPLSFLRCCGKEPDVIVDPSDKKSDAKNIQKSQKRVCKSSVEFFVLMGLLIDCAENQFTGLNEVIQILSFPEGDGKKRALIPGGLDGLTLVGEFMWILTYGFQNLIDYEKKTEPKNMVELKVLFAELAQSAQGLQDIAEYFHRNVITMRKDALGIVKRVIKIYKVKNNPFEKYPAEKKKKPPVRKRLESTSDNKSQDNGRVDEGFFEIKWSPFVLMIQMSKEKPAWVEFDSLGLEERQKIYQIFLQTGYELLEDSSKKVFDTCKGLSEIQVRIEGPGAEPGNRDQLKIKQNGRELTGAMEQWVKNHSPNSRIAEEERPKDIESLLERFWGAIDTLYDKSYEILRLAYETRDSVRICYLYMEHFYHLKPPDFDQSSSFLSKKKLPSLLLDVKRKRSYGYMGLGRINSSDRDEKEVSETTIYSSLVEFTTSIYQTVGQTNPIYAEGMRLAISSEEDEIPEVKSIIPEVEKSIKKKEAQNKSRK